jgi:hypothetical protein
MTYYPPTAPMELIIDTPLLEDLMIYPRIADLSLPVESSKYSYSYYIGRFAGRVGSKTKSGTTNLVAYLKSPIGKKNTLRTYLTIEVLLTIASSVALILAGHPILALAIILFHLYLLYISYTI